MKRRRVHEHQAPHSSKPLTVDEELTLAGMNPHIPELDLHGLPQDGIFFEIDRFLDRHAGSVVRIVYGNGREILKDAVTRVLRELSEKDPGRILGFSHEVMHASCVARIG